jgi:hypothetical protein
MLLQINNPRIVVVMVRRRHSRRCADTQTAWSRNRAVAVELEVFPGHATQVQSHSMLTDSFLPFSLLP